MPWEVKDTGRLSPRAVSGLTGNRCTRNNHTHEWGIASGRKYWEREHVPRGAGGQEGQGLAEEWVVEEQFCENCAVRQGGAPRARN